MKELKLKLTPELHRELKLHAVRHNQSMQSLVVHLIEKELAHG